VIVTLRFGTPQVRPGTSRVDLRPGSPLFIGLGASATSPEELDGATAFVWTNYGADDPSAFHAVPMISVAPTDELQRAFSATLPPAIPGTFLAAAFVELDGERHWASTANRNRNRVFRVPDPAVDALYVREVPVDKVNARAGSTEISTVDDMLDDQPGHYSLARLAREGVNCVWLQVPYRHDLWDGLQAVDDAGSDYASTDWFSIDPELSLVARKVPAWDLA
jgi:hypothetical protein